MELFILPIGRIRLMNYLRKLKNFNNHIDFSTQKYYFISVLNCINYV